MLHASIGRLIHALLQGTLRGLDIICTIIRNNTTSIVETGKANHPPEDYNQMVPFLKRMPLRSYNRNSNRLMTNLSCRHAFIQFNTWQSVPRVTRRTATGMSPFVNIRRYNLGKALLEEIVKHVNF